MDKEEQKQLELTVSLNRISEPRSGKEHAAGDNYLLP
jgi:hypothetical protein